MTPLHPDTHPKIEALQIELIRRMLAGLILGEDLVQKVYGEFSDAK